MGKQCLWAAFVSALISLNSCALPGFSSASHSDQGKLRFSVLWPQLQAFQIQLIPADTETLEVSISGQGLKASQVKTLTRKGSRARLQVELPVGPKQVRVKALDANHQILADGSTQVEILPNQTVQAEVELQAKPEEPQPEPSASHSGGSGNGSSSHGSPPSGPEPNPTGENSGSDMPTGSDSSPPPDTPPPVPEVSPSTDTASPQPSATATSHSGSRGGSSSGSTSLTAPSILGITATPTTVSGLGYPSQIKVEVNDPSQTLQANSYTWTCIRPDTSTGCGSFAAPGNGPDVIWYAPMTSGGPYSLQVTLDNGIHSPVSTSIQITVNDGSGSADLSPGRYDNGTSSN